MTTIHCQAEDRSLEEIQVAQKEMKGVDTSWKLSHMEEINEEQQMRVGKGAHLA